MSERHLKTLWHAGLAALAVVEYCTAATNFRKLFCGACAGWHVAAAIEDFKSR